ncbi:MAG TPA: BTAD domain-containing putative transcriptional regulator [Spirillospora sp.]|nr:BTAD domain-containing putative transcriptional regulator [Spirillospora sp.]
MINFEVLGRVTAWRSGRVADLQPVQQLLLARLVAAGGELVSRTELAVAVWDGKDPNAGLKRVVSEVRGHLRALLPEGAGDLLPAIADGYLLPLREEQADILRFAAGLRRVRDAGDHECGPLVRAALAEWGAGARGLYGGEPLAGLPGGWAEQTRSSLRAAHRDLRFRCLQQDMHDHHYERLTWECEQLATDLEALHDEPFIELWMLAAYRAGLRTRALEIYRHSTESAAGHLEMPLRRSLHHLAELIREEDPRLGEPAGLPMPPMPVAAGGPSTAASTSPLDEGKSMTDPSINITAAGNARVGAQIARNDGDVRIGMEPDPAAPGNEPVGEPAAPGASEEEDA